MAVKMRYVPTSGSLSGISFEKQTERAFNELGVEIDNANTTASEALGVATQAENNSNQAILSVQAATETANDASLKADAANSVAQQASAAANAAQTAANNATDQSATAMTNAQAALSGVADATDTANNALNVATQAKGTAQTAVAQAQQAVNMFVNGMAYTVTPDATDLNTIYSAQRLYLTGTVNNAPIAVPFYLDVVSTNDVTGATQRAWSPDNPQEIYSRSAAIVNPTSQNPSVTWGAWQSLSLNAQPLGQIPPPVSNATSVGWVIGPGSYGITMKAGWTNFDPVLLGTAACVDMPFTANILYNSRMFLPVPIHQAKFLLYLTSQNSSDNLQFALWTATQGEFMQLPGNLVAQTISDVFTVPSTPYTRGPGAFRSLQFTTPVDIPAGNYMLGAWSTNATTGTLRALQSSYEMNYIGWVNWGILPTANMPGYPLLDTQTAHFSNMGFWAAITNQA